MTRMGYTRIARIGCTGDKEGRQFVALYGKHPATEILASCSNPEALGRAMAASGYIPVPGRPGIDCPATWKALDEAALDYLIGEYERVFSPAQAA